MNKDLAVYAFIIIIGALIFSSCADTNSPIVLDIVDMLQESDEDFSMLLEALEQTGLEATLLEDGPFTLFAPTNYAFQDLLDSDSSWNSVSDINNSTLTSILLFHLLSTKVNSTELSDGFLPTLSSGPNVNAISLQVQVTGGTVFNGTANSLSLDIIARNGIIHAIDEVMLPPTVFDVAANNQTLSDFYGAASRIDLLSDFVTTLSGSGPFTVFMPTNSAFQNFLNSNATWDTVLDVSFSTMEAVLNNHILAGSNILSTQFSNNQTISTIGTNLTVGVADTTTLTTDSNQVLNVIVTDIQASNGVVHLVDQVITIY